MKLTQILCVNRPL